MRREWPRDYDWFNLAVGVVIGIDLSLIASVVAR